MKMPSIIKQMLGHKPEEEKRVADAKDTAHEIKNQIRDVDQQVLRLNELTDQKLNEISRQLKSITYQVGVATGGKNRGLK